MAGNKTGNGRGYISAGDGNRITFSGPREAVDAFLSWLHDSRFEDACAAIHKGTRPYTPDDRDRQWIKRELGDVERRVIDATAHGIVWGRPGVVPVESLGRDG